MKLLSLAALWASAVAAQNAGNDTGPAIKVNQVGYLANGPKRATLVSDASEPQDWKLLNKAGDVQASGKTTPRGLDVATKEEVHIVDFSKFKTTGKSSPRTCSQAAWKIMVCEQYQLTKHAR